MRPPGVCSGPGGRFVSCRRSSWFITGSSVSWRPSGKRLSRAFSVLFLLGRIEALWMRVILLLWRRGRVILRLSTGLGPVDVRSPRTYCPSVFLRISKRTHVPVQHVASLLLVSVSLQLIYPSSSLSAAYLVVFLDWPKPKP
uniref:Uncharacterized protein LOC111133139 isoform X2 n=1 Tax=Crassostrea virginica TaxID=6565 RepID=A0A8B8EBJ4_CRAVI|nr:uncharacterized protein LOC111133139 isoform X2 [Crassostrea virginica]